MPFLSKYFDKVVCCNLAERPDRRFFIEEQYRRLYGELDIEFHTSVLHPNGILLAGSFCQLCSPNAGKFNTPNEMWYMFEFYTIIKKAFLENRKSLLLLEDDIRFHKDPERLRRYLDKLPDDWDIIQGDMYSNCKGVERFVSGPEEEWVQHQGYGFWNCGFVGFSRNGMKYVLAIFEKYFAPADYPVWCSVLYPEIIKTYSSARPLVIQTSKKDTNISSVLPENILANRLEFTIKPEEFFSWEEVVTEEILEKKKELENMKSEYIGYAQVKQRL